MAEAASSGTQWAAFHEAAVLSGIWLLVLFVGIHTLSAMNAILVPLLWAFFLMMGLLPAADAIESLILHTCEKTGCALACLCRGLCRAARCLCSMCSRRRSPRLPLQHEGVEVNDYMRSAAPMRTQSRDEDSDDGEAQHRRRSNCCRQLARIVSVLLVVGCFFGIIALFFMMIVRSAQQMQENWEVYKKGAARIARDVNQALSGLSKLFPGMVDKLTKQALDMLGNIVTLVLQPMMEQAAGFVVELIMMLLYMVFWLCNPIEINSVVANLFKRYILLKGLSSLLYAFFVWTLLHFLSVDLAIVFGCITFMFNFIPEVGPFVASVLPAPVILFDGRLQYPWLTLAEALGGTLFLKFLFGNIVEVKLIEKDHSMRMHPVVILFCVAFFGFVWGPTGMLLSVPIMATVKAIAQQNALPPLYRDGVLRLLEGVKQRRRSEDAQGTGGRGRQGSLVDQIAQLLPMRVGTSSHVVDAEQPPVTDCSCPTWASDSGREGRRTSVSPAGLGQAEGGVPSRSD